MRCVCKPWNALLSDSFFVKLHLLHSIRNNDEILLFFGHGSDFDCSPFKAGPTRSFDLELTNFLKLPLNSQSKNGCGRVIGSVNGLICFSYGSLSDHVVYIWNPSLSAVLTLPPCLSPYTDSVNIDFRFGFDPKTNDYKVIKVRSRFDQNNMLLEVEVYSMRKGSWELITQRFPSHITVIMDGDKVCADGHDGHLHWLGFAGNLECNLEMIVAFDLGAQTFSEMPLPDSILHQQENRRNVLGVFGGKLCVVSHILDGDEYEVWVMDEYGVAKSWVKHHVFPQLSAIMAPYGFTSHSEFLFRDYDRFGLYDPIAAQTKSVKISGVVGISKVVEYVDNLVWEAPVVRELS